MQALVYAHRPSERHFAYARTRYTMLKCYSYQGNTQITEHSTHFDVLIEQYTLTSRRKVRS